jgi:hypothetical protein
MTAPHADYGESGLGPDAPRVVGRLGHAGDPPLYGLDPQYVPPDELPEIHVPPAERKQSVSPEYGVLVEFLFGQQWLNVTSSNIAAIQYFDKEQLLYIEYLSGAIYGYTDVTVDEAMDFAAAPSKGRWRHQHLPVSRNNYFIVTVGGSPGAKLPKHAQGKDRYTMRKLRPGQRRSYQPGSMGRGPQRF